MPNSASTDILCSAALPADAMDAAIVDKRLAGFHLALVLRWVVILDPFFVIPLMLRISDNVVVHEDEWHFSPPGL
jgi:hypothetical protein